MMITMTISLAMHDDEDDEGVDDAEDDGEHRHDDGDDPDDDVDDEDDVDGALVHSRRICCGWDGTGPAPPLHTPGSIWSAPPRKRMWIYGMSV